MTAHSSDFSRYLAAVTHRYMQKAANKPGLWANIRAKKKRGDKPAKPGDKDYPDSKSWKKVTSISAKKEAASSPAWQREAGKNEEGGLNAKGRASYNKATGGNLKAPVTESNPKGDRNKRQNSFCARMCGMKRVNTGGKTKKDPDSRINKSLRKWNCKCGSDEEKQAMLPGVIGGFAGAAGGALTGKKDKVQRAIGRGALIGAATELGMTPGMALGMIPGAMLGNAIAGPEGAKTGLVLGGGLGMGAGGMLGNAAAQGLLGPYETEEELAQELEQEKQEEQKMAAFEFGVKMAQNSGGLAEFGNAIGGMANQAIQSRPGQSVLGGAAHMYNNYAPQGMRNFVSQQMPNYYEDDETRDILQQDGVKNLAPQPFQNQRATQGVAINSETVVENDRLVKDQIDSYAPATNFGTPLQQIGFGLAGGQLPGQTFKPNDAATYHLGTNNDSIVQNRLLPGKFDQQTGSTTSQSPAGISGMTKTQSAFDFGRKVATVTMCSAPKHNDQSGVDVNPAAAGTPEGKEKLTKKKAPVKAEDVVTSKAALFGRKLAQSLVNFVERKPRDLTKGTLNPRATGEHEHEEDTAEPENEEDDGLIV